MSPQHLFVAGAHTDVGKTHVACALIRAARGLSASVEALKPVVSGFDASDWAQSDPGRLLASLGEALNTSALDEMSPWRFAAPLAPPMAARLEGHPLPLAPVVDFCRKRIAQARADLMLVEGVGGLMSPIAERATGLDLMMALSLPTVLVGGSYLGAISHTLTALEVLRARGLPVAAVVVSASPGEGLPDFETTVGTISGFAGEVPVFAVPRNVSEDWAPVLLATARRLVGPGLADRP